MISTATPPSPAPQALPTPQALPNLTAKPVEAADPGWTAAKTMLPEPKPAASPAVMTPILPEATATPTPATPVAPKPAPTAATPPAPVSAGALSDEQILELEHTIRDACRSSATILEVYATKPGKLTVRLIAQSDAMAEEAVRVASQLPQLAPYAVEFEGKVIGK
jgi:hypothetical protein